MQRCLSIGRRATKPALVTAGVLLSTYELLKQSLMQSGRLEESLSKVTSSKIGIHEGTVNSRSELLKRLKRYRMLFGIVNTSRESQILARLEHAIEDMETDVSTGALRKQPFCVVLYGNPGVGKSSFSIQLAQKLMHGRYGRFTSHDMVTLNETDEYQSEFRTSHKVVLFDDIGAAKSDRPDTTNPWRKVIDFVNNVQKTALNPNCEMKGKVYIQPDLVILTTNLDLSKTFAMVGGFMNCPEAIARRCSSVIHLKDYLTGEIINYDGGSDHSTAYCGKMPTNLKSGLGTTVTRDYIVEELDKRFREHMIDQQKFINRFNSYFDDLPTIVEDYSEQSEIYELQAAIAPKYDPLHEERITNYLISHIDWDYYFCAYPYGHNEEVYYFDGYIYSSFGKYPNQAIRLHQDYMNELRQKMLDITPDPYQDQEVMEIPGLLAEGNTTSIVAESDSCVVSDFQNDAFCCDDHLLGSFEKQRRHKQSLLKRSVFGIPCRIDNRHPQWIQLSQFALQVKDALSSWDDLRSLAGVDNANLNKKWARLKLRYDNDDVDLTDSMLKRIFRKIALQNFNKFELHPISIETFLILSPVFGFTNKNQSEAQLRLLKSIDECQLLEGSSHSVESSDNVSTDTPLESTTGDSYYRDALRNKVNNPIGMILTSSDSESQVIRWSLTEDQQCDQFLRIINFPKKSIMQEKRHLNFNPYGEIDLILECDDFIFVVEMKMSNKPEYLCKADAQAKKYGGMISVLRPGTRVFGIIYSPSGIEIRYDNGLPYESNVCDDLFLILGYTKL